MNIVILGAGALGTVLGAHLAKAGEDVTLITRGERAAFLQKHGATISGLVDFNTPVTVVTNPQQVQEASETNNGLTVEFEVGEGKKGPCATNVVPA